MIFLFIKKKLNTLSRRSLGSNCKIIFIRLINNFYFLSLRVLRKFKEKTKLVINTFNPKIKDFTFNKFILIKSLITGEGLPARFYLKREIDLIYFFKELKRLKINYVVLRWHREVLKNKFDDDVDLLCSDDDLKFILKFCVLYNNGNVTLDIYSVSGLSNTNYNGHPYYPPYLAEKILKSRVIYKNLLFIPSRKIYLLSFIYHLIFHKGYDLEILQHTNNKIISLKKNRYMLEIKKIVNKSNIKLKTYDYKEFLKLLRKNNWLPQIDSIKQYSNSNHLIKLLYKKNNYKGNRISRFGEIIVFIVREWAINGNYLPLIKNILTLHSYELVEEFSLHGESKIKASKYIRGGEWGRGPYPICGGKPSYVIVCYDFAPKLLTKNENYKNNKPNFKYATIKEKIRNRINQNLFFFNHVNCLHSSDDEWESIEYLKRINPNVIPLLEKRISIIENSSYFLKWNVIEDIVPCGTRSRTQVIDFDNAMYVLKIFKPNCHRFFKREIFAFNYFKKYSNLLPKLKKIGDNYIITKYYDNILKEKNIAYKKMIIKKFTLEIIRFMKIFYDHDYAIINFNPENLIITRDMKLKIMDFEFLYKYKNKPKYFLDSYDIQGVPKEFESDLPLDDVNNFNHTWDGYLDKKVLRELFKYHS